MYLTAILLFSKGIKEPKIKDSNEQNCLQITIIISDIFLIHLSFFSYRGECRSKLGLGMLETWDAKDLECLGLGVLGTWDARICNLM